MGRCGRPSAELHLERSGPLLHLRILGGFTLSSMMCTAADDAGVPDEERFGECSDLRTEPAGSACGATNAFYRHDLFIEEATRTQVAYYEGGATDDAVKPRASLLSWTLEAKGATALQVSAPHCTQVVSWSR
jgi:hypothetical protein